MTETTAHSPPAGTQPTTLGSPVRLLVLVGLLAIVIGAWSYDYWVAGPSSESTYQKIQTMVDEKNAKGVKDGGVVRPDDVKQTVGFAPTWVEKKADHTIEWYCWWGKIPVLSTWKRYITVVYVGEPLHFNTHHQNEPPPAEALPGYLEKMQSEHFDDKTAMEKSAATTPGPGGMSPMPSGSRGGGRGKAPGPGGEPTDTPPEGKPADTTGEAPKEGDKPAEATKEGDKPAESPKAGDKPAEAPKVSDKPIDSPQAADKPAEEPK